MIWFTADTHFGHESILRLCNRDFASIEEHDQQLIIEWNSVVKDGDRVFHLGDWSIKGLSFMAPIFSKLNGDITTIRGNHDRNCWVDCDVMRQSINGRVFFMSHYAHLVWDGQHADRKTIHLFGHSHGNLSGVAGSMDVGVDVANRLLGSYRPFSVEDVVRFIDNKEIEK